MSKKKRQGLKTLGDYRRAAKESLYEIGLRVHLRQVADLRKAGKDSLNEIDLPVHLPQDKKSTSPYDAIKTALFHSRHLIYLSRAEFPRECDFGICFPGTKYEMRNLPLFHCIKLMEFAVTYKDVQSAGELFQNSIARRLQLQLAR